MKRKVVIITDCIDIAFLEIRGAIYSSSSDDNFTIEPVVNVDSYNIVNTSFMLRLIAEVYPQGTVICVIINPIKKRTERIAGITEKKNIYFEGTNTGVFGWLLKDFGCKELIELHDPGFISFGGKYVHAPAVGKIASGTKLSKLGEKFDLKDIRDISIQIGTILHMDNFGNVKLYHKLEEAKNGDKYRAYIGNKTLDLIYWERMMARDDGEWVIYPGSSFGFTEIGEVRGKGFLSMNVKPGDIIKIEKL